MNEAVIRKIIHKKLELAEQLLEHMPPKLAETVREAGTLVLEELYKGAKEVQKTGVKQEKDKSKLNEVQIE